MARRSKMATDDEEQLRLDRARRVRERVRNLKDRSEHPKDPSLPPPSSETPREFVHRRMAELELEEAADTDPDI
jgi:hypothetical protein